MLIFVKYNYKCDQVMAKNYFQLDENAVLFNLLRETKPDWWSTILKDRELYINIRKGNRINVYYKGFSVMELSLSRKKELQAKIHSTYMGKDTCGYLEHLDPNFIIEHLAAVKQVIDNNNDKHRNMPEGRCEKEIQGLCYVHGEYLDTEYEFVREIPQRLITRIDFTTITDDGLIEFVELKRITDKRLLVSLKSENEPEILKQIKDYNAFIYDNEISICDYYRMVQRIMHSLGVKNRLVECEIKGVVENVRLLLAGCKVELNATNNKKIRRMLDLLEKNSIKYNIEVI